MDVSKNEELTTLSDGELFDDIYPSMVHLISGDWYIFTPSFTRKDKEGYGRRIIDEQAGRM